MNNKTIKPNFLVVGAAKAGTSWLHYCLNAHPEIFVPKVKELHFFSYPYVYQKGNEWYESFFDSASSETVIGEVCPSYISFPNVPERIHQYNPNMKLIFVLRNPIQRAYSHYCMGMKQGKLDFDIDSHLNHESNYVQLGLYYQQITRFLQYFSLDHLKIITFDELKTTPQATLKEIYTYLNVNSDFSPSESVLKPKNVSSSLPKFPILYKFLKEKEKQISNKSRFLRGLITDLRLQGKLQLLHKLNQGKLYPKLSENKKRSLAKFYAQDVNNLSQLINKDLQIWLQPYLQ